MSEKNKHTVQSKEAGIDRKKVTPRHSKKSFKEAADHTYRKHKKSFKKLAE